MSRRPHEESDGDVRRRLLNIFKEDVVKLFLSLISENVHMDCALAPPENVVLAFVT